MLLEFQSTVDSFMALRVLTYVALLYQDLVRRRQLGPSGRLPPVLPIVLYNGEERWNASTEVASLVEEAPRRLARHCPRFEYLLIDEGAFGDGEIASSQKLAAALFGLEKCRTPETMTEVLVRLFEGLREPERASLRRSFAVFLNRVYFRKRKGMVEALASTRDPEEMQTMLAKNVERWERAAEERGEARGETRGEAHGREEERRALARRMIAEKLDLDLIRRLTGLGTEEIEAEMVGHVED